jgi:hypothetical protein
MWNSSQTSYFALFTKCYDYIKDKMGRMEMRNAPSVGQPDGKRPAGIYRRKKEDNIKADLE